MSVAVEAVDGQLASLPMLSHQHTDIFHGRTVLVEKQELGKIEQRRMMMI